MPTPQKLQTWIHNLSRPIGIAKIIPLTRNFDKIYVDGKAIIVFYVVSCGTKEQRMIKHLYELVINTKNRMILGVDYADVLSQIAGSWKSLTKIMCFIDAPNTAEGNAISSLILRWIRTWLTEPSNNNNNKLLNDIKNNFLPKAANNAAANSKNVDKLQTLIEQLININIIDEIFDVEDDGDIIDEIDDVDNIENDKNSENDKNIEMVDIENDKHIANSENDKNIEMVDIENDKNSENDKNIEMVDIENDKNSENDKNIEMVDIENDKHIAKNSENDKNIEMVDIENDIHPSPTNKTNHDRNYINNKVSPMNLRNCNMGIQQKIIQITDESSTPTHSTTKYIIIDDSSTTTINNNVSMMTPMTDSDEESDNNPTGKGGSLRFDCDTSLITRSNDEFDNNPTRKGGSLRFDYDMEGIGGQLLRKSGWDGREDSLYEKNGAIEQSIELIPKQRNQVRYNLGLGYDGSHSNRSQTEKSWTTSGTTSWTTSKPQNNGSHPNHIQTAAKPQNRIQTAR